MIPDFPTTRVEYFLAAILGQDVALPAPQSRTELYLAKILGQDVEVPAPQSRTELYLAKILGQDVEVPAPQTRSDCYLAKLAGMDVALPDPQTRLEAYLQEWAQNDAQYATAGPAAIAAFNALRAASLRSLVVDLPYKAAGYTEINIISANENLVEKYLEHGLAPSEDHYNYRDTTGTSVLFRCKAGVTYYVKRGTGANRATWGFFYDKPVAGSSQTVAHQANSNPATAPLDGWCIFYLKASSYDETCVKGTQVSLEAPGDVVLPDTTVLPITIPTPPGTVYGGTLNVISGIVTATKDADGNDITPVEYTLTAQEVDTRIGANTVWADAGDVTVEYRSN